MRFVALFLLLFFVSGHLPAQETTPKKSWTVDDIVMQESARAWELSDDGAQALWIKSQPDRARDGLVSTLMITDLATGEHRALTVGQNGFSAARFVPGGREVSFLSSREFPKGSKGPKKEERGSQIWVLDLRGGEARPLTAIDGGVGQYHWHDASTLFLSARDRKTRLEAAADEAKDDSIVVEDPALFRARAQRLFRFDRKTKTLARLTENRAPLSRFWVSPDAGHVIASYDQSASFDAESDRPPRFFLHDLRDGDSRELFAERKHKPSDIVWRRDSTGAWILFPKSTHDGESWAAITTLKSLSLPDASIRDIDLDDAGWGIAGNFRELEDGFLLAINQGLRLKWRRFRRLADGSVRGEHLRGSDQAPLHALLTARDSDRIVLVRGSASDPDHIKRARLDGNTITDEKPLYRPNGGFADHWIAPTKAISWKGALDEEVEGLLYYPRAYEEGQRYPLILVTHGGPHGHDSDRFTERWSNSPNLLAQRGAFVLKTNYHGSSGYGLAFGESIRKRYYELELIDMFSGIKKLDREGLVDTKRMGVVGWSNGAILSTAAVTLADRFAPGFDYDFKVCCPGAGDVNWTSDYGNCSFGASFDEFYLGGTPWTNLPGYIEKSPLYEVENVTTPTIIFFGTRDRAVPTEQGWQWYRALHRAGKAPVRFVLFPGEPHGLRKLTHQRRKLVEEMAWIDQHLFGTKPKDLPEALLDTSPAAVAIAKSGFAREGMRWGRLRDGVLTPETVPWKPGLELARFEVTWAQWAAYARGAENGDSDSETLAERARLRPNHPAVGIDGPRARRYVRWLRERTGRDWRLLTVEELRSLASRHGGRPNTLDWWAGYAAGGDDAKEIRRRLEALGAARILDTVDARAPGVIRSGDVRNFVFGLGGNAAELALDAEGRALGVGPWALGYEDGREPRQEPPLTWTGLRLAVGPASPSKK
jgi:dipeptidyl aminopeptidase/acylaminoacyl peptidase